MIPRYAPPELTMIWSDQAKYRRWLEATLDFCDYAEAFGPVPAETTARIRDAMPDVLDEARIAELESVIRHDFLAFLAYMEEVAGPDGRWIHHGLTSSDIVDSCTSVALWRAGDVLVNLSAALVSHLRDRAREHEETPMVGRTHGMWAEPTTFGLALASHMTEVDRCKDRLESAVEGVRFGKMSGAVGNYRSCSWKVEEHTLGSLGLNPLPGSLQVLSRDCYAHFFQCCALMASALERLAVNVRHWQRSEVAEASEPFGGGQKGSSAMPHKRNPVTCEKICGLSRIVRSLASASLENVPLWHERDISHSSAERFIAPDVTCTLGHMLTESARVVAGLRVDRERMAANLAAAGDFVHSGALMLQLVRFGMGRGQAHSAVQAACSAYAEDRDTPLVLHLMQVPGVPDFVEAPDLAAVCRESSFLRGSKEAVLMAIASTSPA